MATTLRKLTPIPAIASLEHGWTGNKLLKHLLACISLALLFTLSSALGQEEALTNEDVVRMTDAGIAPSVIVAKIKVSETDFDVSVDALLALTEGEVAQEVLEAMLAAGDGQAEKDAPGFATPSPDTSSPGAVPESAGGAPQPKAIPGSRFREALGSGGEGPEMVVVPAGSFRMGCLSNELCLSSELPVRTVTIAEPFAVSVHEVTFEDYDRFTHPNRVDDEGWGRGRRPVINVSWDDAKEYVAWLSARTGGSYRLLSEAEWEYAARAGSESKYSWGDEIGTGRANCWLDECGDRFDRTAPVGSFPANAFGLHDMHGNVWEWVEDCWNSDYAGAPANGGAWLSGDCTDRVVRGGSWYSDPRALRSAYREWDATGGRYDSIGFRVARTLSP